MRRRSRSRNRADALARPHAVVTHRHAWFVDKVALLLAEQGVTVLACTDNGAEALGAVVAEQPDVLLVEDALPQVTGMQILAAKRRYAPRTMTAIQVPYEDGLIAAFDAGAVAVFTRRIPPADISGELARLVATG